MERWTGDRWTGGKLERWSGEPRTLLATSAACFLQSSGYSLFSYTIWGWRGAGVERWRGVGVQGWRSGEVQGSRGGDGVM